MDNLTFEDLTQEEKRAYIVATDKLTTTLNYELNELTKKKEITLANHKRNFLRDIARDRANKEKKRLIEIRKNNNSDFLESFSNEVKRHIAGQLIANFDGDPDDNATWRILGEDPNCDLGGSHHEPDLGIVEGTLKEVISYALTLDGFISWGSGGRIQRYHNPAVKKLGV